MDRYANAARRNEPRAFHPMFNSKSGGEIGQTTAHQPDILCGCLVIRLQAASERWIAIE